MKQTIVFADLFSGIGGFHVGLDKFAKEHNLETKLHKAVEIDPTTASDYDNNFNTTSQGDVKSITYKDDLKGVCLLMAGFPCQSFSKAGSRLGFEDPTRGTLFFEIKRVLKESVNEGEPIPYVLLENVTNIITHDKGNTWQTIKEGLEELGYVSADTPIVMGPHELGTPQSRNRAFIPAIHKSVLNNTSNVITKPTETIKLHSTRCETIIGDSLDNRKQTIASKRRLEIINFYDGFIKILKQNPKQLLGFPMDLKYINDKTDHDLTDVAAWKIKVIDKNKQLYADNKQLLDIYFTENKQLIESMTDTERLFEWQAGKHIDSLKEGIITFRPSGLRVKRPTEFPTLVKIVQTPIIYDNELETFREITITEGKRLQGLDDDHILNEKPLKAWQQLGNAVNADVIHYMLNVMYDFKKQN